MEKEKAKKKSLPKPKIEVQFVWNSPEREWEPKDRVWYLKYAALFSVFILLSARLGFFIMILALIALMFLIFVQASIPPFISEHKLTSEGIITHGILIKWEQLKHFWYGRKRSGQWILYLDYKPAERQPRISLLINEEEAQEIFNVLIQKLKYANKLEADYNFIALFLYGEYIPVSNYLEDLDQPTTKEDTPGEVEDEDEKESKKKGEDQQSSPE